MIASKIWIDVEHILIESWFFKNCDKHLQNVPTSDQICIFFLHHVMVESICTQHLSKFCWRLKITILCNLPTVIHDINLLSIWCKQNHIYVNINLIFILYDVNMFMLNQIFILDENGTCINTQDKYCSIPILSKKILCKYEYHPEPRYYPSRWSYIQ